MILLLILILVILLYQHYYIKEGLNFTHRYFVDHYEKNNIIFDKTNHILEKDGKIINYNNLKSTSIISKPITNQILQEHGIPVSKSYIWNNEITSNENISNIQHLKFPLVIKPSRGEKGRHVTTNIMTTTELLKYVNDLKKRGKIPFIEEQANGKEYRIMVLNDTIIGITMKTSPFIIGDGTHTIDELIHQLNSTKSKTHKIHTVDYKWIKKQGYSSSDILSLGEKVIITNVKNMSNGSIITYVDINTVNPINLSMFKQINKILNLKLSGIDYICEDLSIPYYLNGCVIEVNINPGVNIHYTVQPSTQKDNLINSIINQVFN